VFDANGIGVLETQWPHITTFYRTGPQSKLSRRRDTIRNVFGVGPLPHTFKENTL